MKIIITLCDPIRRLVSDFVHTRSLKASEQGGAAQQIRVNYTSCNDIIILFIKKAYRNLDAFLSKWIPHVNMNLRDKGDAYLKDIFYSDPLATVLTNG